MGYGPRVPAVPEFSRAPGPLSGIRPGHVRGGRCRDSGSVSARSAKVATMIYAPQYRPPPILEQCFWRVIGDYPESGRDICQCRVTLHAYPIITGSAIVDEAEMLRQPRQCYDFAFIPY